MSATTTPAEERYTGADLDMIQLCEYNAVPFTSGELDVIDRYREATAGTEDCFDCEISGSDLVIPDGFTRSQVLSMIEAHFRTLNDWHEQVCDLETQLGRAAGDDRSTSHSAGNFIGREWLSWSCAREGYRSAVIEYLLGRDEHGYRFDPVRIPDGFLFDDGQCWLSPA